MTKVYWIDFQIAAQIRYIKESDEIRLAMQPLELIKRVSMASNLNEFIFMTLSYKLNKGKEKTYIRYWWGQTLAF